VSGRFAAPGRVNLIGEHTDYNDGFVLPFALPQQTVVTGRIRPSGDWLVESDLSKDIVHFSVDDLEPGRVSGWAAHVAGVVWALHRHGFPTPGAHLTVSSTVPVGSGLSSSAALQCAVLACLDAFGGRQIPVNRWPGLAQLAENGYVGVPCGIMDQTAATRCTTGHALFLDCRTLAVTQIPFDPAADGLAVLLIDSMVRHRHSDNAYAQRRDTCEQAAKTLGVQALRDIDDLPAALGALADPVARKRVRHVVTENARVLATVDLLRSGRIRDVGPLLTASHESMRDDFENSVAEVDTAVEAALAAGARGARMTGGGFGGCVIALIDTAAVDAVRGAVSEAYAAKGFHQPGFSVVAPSAGAAELAGLV
jgi:galactokinase